MVQSQRVVYLTVFTQKNNLFSCFKNLMCDLVLTIYDEYIRACIIDATARSDAGQKESFRPSFAH